MIHVILFTALCLVALVYLGSEFKQVCEVERRYMQEVEFVTWGNDKEVAK